MRDKKRIRAFCNRLANAWEHCPDLRFGQFMMNVFGRMRRDPFFPEDDEMIRYIEQNVVSGLDHWLVKIVITVPIKTSS